MAELVDDDASQWMNSMILSPLLSQLLSERIVGEMVRVENKVIRMFSVLKSIVVDAESAMIGLTRVRRLVVKAIIERPRFFWPTDTVTSSIQNFVDLLLSSNTENGILSHLSI